MSELHIHNSSTAKDDTHRFVTIKELVNILAISRSSIYAKLNQKSASYDPAFPKPRRLGAASVRWFLPDVYRWLADCV